MPRSREVRVAILGDSRDFSRAVRDARSDADRLDGSFSRVASGAGRMSSAIALAAGGAVVAGGALAMSFIRAAEESQQVTRQTEAVIRSMGGAANVTAEQVAALSTELSLKSGIDDELIQSGQNVLLTFGRVRNEVGRGNDIFTRATASALDMSVALGQDMTSSAMMVGKALNDPIRGLTALRRSGIQFTNEQERQIRRMVDANDVIGAQGIMLGELERQFGGSAEAQSTASGRMAVAWDNIKEQIGSALLPAFESASTWLTERLPAAMETGGDIIDGLRGAWERLTTAIFGEGDWDSFWSDVQAGWGEAGKRWDTFTSNVQRGWEEFTDEVFGSETSWDSFWDDVERGWHRFRDFATDYIDDVKRGWHEFTSSVAQFVGPFFESLGAIGRTLGSFSEMFDDTIGSLGSSDVNLDDLVGFLNRHGIGDKPPGPMLPSKPSLAPIKGPFHSGGVVPGPRGSNQLALVAGGETILPTHRGGMAGGVHLSVVGDPDAWTVKRLTAAAMAAAGAVNRNVNWSVA